MGRPPRHAFTEETTTRVLRAAEAAFGAHGYHSARLEDIAAAASIQRPSLLYHFKSKARLYHTVLDRAFEQLGALVIRCAMPERGPEVQVNAFVDALLTFAEDHRGLVCTLARELMDPHGVARGLVVERLGALVDGLDAALVESMTHSPSPPLPPGFPTRAAILQLVSAYLMRAGTDSLGDALWGPEDPTRRLAKALLLGQHEG